MAIHINVEDYSNSASIQISGSGLSLKKLGLSLMKIDGELSFHLQKKVCNFYPFPIDKLSFQVINQYNTINSHEGNIKFLSDNETFQRLGCSLVNFFGYDAVLNQHLHIDKYDRF